MNQDKILEEAKVYIEGSSNIEETAKKLGISKKTLQIHLKKLQELNPDVYQLILKKRKENSAIGTKIGGQKGKRKANYTLKEANELARLIINRQLTYQEASEITEIPTSTIYDMIHSSYIDEKTSIALTIVAESNRQKITTEEYKSQHHLK